MEQLLDRLYEKLDQCQNNTNKLYITRLKVSSANRKTFIQKFEEMCTKLNRPVNDVKQFFEEELSTSTTIDSSGNMIVTGLFKQEGVDKILSNYIKQYVQCSECKSCNTVINKESKITFINCSKCLSKKALL